MAILFFKTTWRNLWNNKTYSFLNVFGLAIGIACAGLIFLWVENELSYDRFNAKFDNLYEVKVNQKYEAYTATFTSTPGILGPAIKAEIPGIANTCRVTEGNTSKLFTIGEKAMYAGGRYVEQSIFSMFTLPFIEGDAVKAFEQTHSIVLTAKTAKKFFGDEQHVIGKTVRVDNKQDYIVSGVIKDLPANASIQFEWLSPFDIYYQQSPWAHKWNNFCLSTYVELKPNTDMASVNKLLHHFIQQKQQVEKSADNSFIFPMKDWHLYNDFDNGVQTGSGGIRYVRLFSAIAWIILLIACINFMNLATARSEKRAREVGVRKVLGSGNKRLILQFIGEALIMSLIATIFAVIIMALALQAFNGLVQKNLVLQLLDPLHFAALLAITVICGLVAGSYPSLYLSSFNPIFVLKGIRAKTGSAAFIRKGLVIVQFSISIILIVSTIIIYQQIQHVKKRNLGFNKDNLLELNMQGDMAKNYAVIRQELMSSGFIENVALSDHETIYSGNNTNSLTWEGKPSDATYLVSNRYVSKDFIKTSGMKLLAGRDFEIADTATGKSINVLITQSLEKLMGKGSAIGKTMRGEGDTTNEIATVIGVVDDYVYGNVFSKSDPVFFACTNPENTTVMYVRTKQATNTEQALASMEKIFKTHNAAYPFQYRFVDEQFSQLFSNEKLISKLSGVFATLAIIISCLGLFGLAAYTAERRTKEIGIRKVLGASVKGIALLVSADFIRLVGLSCLIAFPIAWWYMQNWLADYTYRIEINWLIFLLAGVLAIAIALATVSFQAIKAAVANPVKSLRTE